jgi:predicted small metal-binding protein
MAIIINLEGGRRCNRSDAADYDCEWEARGKDEDEILAAVERHGMEWHNRKPLTEQESNKIRVAIRDKPSLC